MVVYKYLSILLPILVGVLANENQTIFKPPSFNITANSDDGRIHCDTLICPNDSIACDYSEKNSVYNHSVIIVMKKCLDKAGNITAMQNSTFIDSNGRIYNMKIFSEKDPNYPNKKEIKNDIKEMQDEIHHDIQNILNGIKKKFGDIQNRLDDF